MSKDYIVEITDGDFEVTVNTDGEYTVNVGEYVTGVGFSNKGTNAEVLDDETSTAANIQFRTLVASTESEKNNIEISQGSNDITFGTKQDMSVRNIFASTSLQAQTGSVQASTGAINNLLTAGSLQVSSSAVLPNITMNGTMSGSGDIDISGDIAAPNMNFSGTITGSDYNDVATIDGTGNITITTGDANFLFADTQDFYVGSLTQSAHITGTEIKSVGERLTLHGELDGAVVYEAKNREGSTISKGTPVYISGHNGNTVEIGIADANDPAKMPAFGIADVDINNNNNGEIVTFGELRGFDTSSFSVGDELFVSETGTLIVTRPAASDAQVQKMAKVVRSHSTNGILFIMGAGRTNDIPNDLDTDDITEASNLYYTDARVQTKLGSVSGDILPDTDLAYDLGSPSNQFRSAYIGPGSLYIDGHKVLGSDETGDIDLTTDPNQNLNIQAGGTITMLSTGEATTLSDDTINLSSASGTTNVLGTLDVADHMEVGDTNYDNGLIDASGTNQNLEIRTNGTGYLHANIGGSAYFGSFSSAVQLDGANKSIGSIGGDLTLSNNTSVNGTLTVNGSSSTKNTVIGDSQIGAYNIHGFTVNGGDTAWAGVSLVETTGSTNKPVNNFSNPAFSTTIFGGTEAAKTGVEANKRIWSAFALASQDGTTPQFANFRILSETTEQQSASARGAKMTIETTANGSTSTTKTLSLQDNEVTINPDGNGVLKSGGTLTLDDDVEVTGTLEVDGSTTLNGPVTLGNANSDQIISTGYLKANNGFGFTVLNTATANYLSGVLGIISAGDTAYISDGDNGNPCLGVYNGSSWKRIALGSDISST